MLKLRHLFRIKLKILLVVVTLLCVAMGTWSYRAKRQQLAVQALSKVGDTSTFSYSYQALPGLPNDYDPKAKPLAPQWLRSLVGDDYFITAERLSVEYKPPARSIDSDALARLSDLPYLEELSLFNVKLNNASISNLRHLTRLRFLHFHTTDSSALSEVDDYRFLKKTPNLQFLSLGKGNFDDDDAQHLARLSGLQRVFIYSSEVGDAGMDSFAQLTELEQLILNRSNVGDDGITKLSELKNLKTLWINFTPVTDASVPKLSKMTGLTSLEVRETGITADGVRRLREALPNCEVNENLYSGWN